VKGLALLIGLVLALLVPAAAFAHPLGNFTINHFTRIQPSGDRIYLLYVLDMAEIPTFQAKDDVAANGQAAYASELARQIRGNLALQVGGKPLDLRELRHAIAFPDGVGGLKTTRLEIVFDAGAVSGGPLPLTYSDDNFSGRLGWKEIVLEPASGAVAVSSSVPSASVSDELRAYPQDLLTSPLDVTAAEAELEPGETAGPPPTLLDGKDLQAPARAVSKTESGFGSLITKENLSVGVILLSLLVAIFWGAAHALSPGHGKAIVAAYLVGARGKPRHAVYLGLITTATHTVGVFALGLITLALSEFIVPDQLYPWLNLVSAMLVVIVGVTVLRSRILDWWRGRSHPGAHAHGHDHRHEHSHDHGHPHDHDHDHAHPHDHDHGDGHSHGGTHHRHVPEEGTGMRGLVAVGISGGLLPCPTALVVLLAAISLHRVGYGLVLIVAFSIGLAATITCIGLLAIGARRVFNRVNFDGRLVRLLPAVSALVILAFGIAMTVRALPGVS